MRRRVYLDARVAHHSSDPGPPTCRQSIRGRDRTTASGYTSGQWKHASAVVVDAAHYLKHAWKIVRQRRGKPADRRRQAWVPKAPEVRQGAAVTRGLGPTTWAPTPRLKNRFEEVPFSRHWPSFLFRSSSLWVRQVGAGPSGGPRVRPADVHVLRVPPTLSLGARRRRWSFDERRGR